ncbi:MAG: Druantia anti-phage system protein DruA, partial [Verrucomicrobiota bacterium]
MKRSKEDESTIVKRVSVRLLLEHERPEFDRLLEERHDLKSARLSGQTLRYVAELDGVWVALVCFGAAALHLKAREKHLGWSPRQRARRLKFVVSNSRFLVLAERQRYPNLASRVLGLCLRRLDADWQARWKHPVLVVESFADESRHSGTCYRACEFKALGLTQGYGRVSRDFYTEHGKPKQLYLRELLPGAAAILRSGRLPGALADHEECLA